jgi:hypothetical protein
MLFIVIVDQQQGSFAKNIQALIPFPNYIFYVKILAIIYKGDIVGLKLLPVSIK